MSNSHVGPRKKRTRQHIIADLSVHYVEGFILEEGHTAQRFGSDYGYDLNMRTFDEEGYAEPGVICFQLKASESLRSVGSTFVFDMDIRDYNLWMQEDLPVMLILFDASRRKVCWLWVQRYFDGKFVRQPKTGAKTVRVRVPKRRILSRSAIRKMREINRQMQAPKLGVVP